MRGPDITQESLFSTVHLENFVPSGHPLRKIRPVFDEGLARIDGLLDTCYSPIGAVSIPPKRLLRVQLLQVLYSIRNERQLVEQIEYNLLFRWFIGLTIDDAVWNHSSFSTNRDRLLEQDIIPQLFAEVVELARKQDLLSDEHFSVDGTLIQARASQKSFRTKDGSDEPPSPGRNGEADFHGKKRKNDTHASVTDPDSRLASKGNGKGAKLSNMGHTVMENRNGLVVNARASKATKTAERDKAIEMLGELQGNKRRTVEADKNYDTQVFVKQCRDINVTPHVARNDKRKGGSAIDGRTSGRLGYLISQRIRKRVEEPFGWGKTAGLLRQLKVRGLAHANGIFLMTMLGWNLTRMKNLQG